MAIFLCTATERMALWYFLTPVKWLLVVLRHVHIVAKSTCYLCCDCEPIWPYISVWLPLVVFLWNLILRTFMKVCWENPNLVELDRNIGQFIWISVNIVLLLATSNCHKIAVLDWSYIRLLVCESVCLSAPIIVAPAGWIYVKFGFGRFLKNSVEFQVWLKSGRNIGCFTWRPKLFHCCWWY